MRHIAHIGETMKTYRILASNLKGRDRLGDNDIDEKIILKLIFKGVKWA
jgi:hypothetical protein